MASINEIKEENAYLKELLSQQSSEVLFVENQLQDTLKPSVLSSQIVQAVLQMSIELGEFIQKKGKSEKAEKSAKRLNNLLTWVIELNSLAGQLNTLQLLNKEIIGRHNNLAKRYNELNKKLENIIAAENFK